MPLPHLLLVEPDAEIRESLATYLEAWFVVNRAGGALEALAAMEAQPAGTVVIELEIPDGYGPGLVSEIRSRWPETAIAILYYYSHRTQSLQPILDRLGDVCIQKPFDLEKVGQTLRNLRPQAPGA